MKQKGQDGEVHVDRNMEYMEYLAIGAGLTTLNGCILYYFKLRVFLPLYGDGTH